MPHVVDVTDSDFHSQVLNAAVPVLVEVWAPWCAPCTSIAPVVEGLAGEFRGRVKFCRVNTDENPSTAMNYRVSSIPTFFLFQGGRVVGQVVGARANDIRSAVVRALETGR